MAAPAIDPLRFFSPAELAAWSAQARVDDWLWLSWLGLRLAFLIGLLVFGIHLALRRGLERLAGRLPPAGRGARWLRPLSRLSDPSGQRPGRWLVDALYPAALMALWTVVALPLSFFSSYLLGHERGLLTMGPGLWWSDWAKGLALRSLFFALLGLGLFGLARRLPRSWWLWLWSAVVGMLLVWTMTSPLRARVFHDFEPLPAGPVRSAVAGLMDEAGYALDDIQLVDTSRRSHHAVAYVMGQGPTRRVVLGDNLVRRFHPREIRVALAHELGHEQRDHRGRGLVTMALAALLFLGLVRLLLWWAPRWRRLGLAADADPAVLPLVLLAALLLFNLNGPLSAWLDRREEVEADRAGLELTRDPVAFCSLMVRLARTNQADPDPPAWRQWLLAHHPSVRQRLEFALDWAAAEGVPVDPQAIPLPSPADRGALAPGDGGGVDPSGSAAPKEKSGSLAVPRGAGARAPAQRPMAVRLSWCSLRRSASRRSSKRCSRSRTPANSASRSRARSACCSARSCSFSARRSSWSARRRTGAPSRTARSPTDAIWP